jgi:hypothetical protein
MAEDWRVTIPTGSSDDGLVARALEGLREREVEREARERLGGRVAVSRDDDHIFLYADTEAAAREAAELVTTLLGEHGLVAEGGIGVERWHPIEERWEDASVGLPGTEAERAAEEERREADEAAEAHATGEAPWEVRIELASHDDATAFAERLEVEPGGDPIWDVMGNNPFAFFGGLAG